MLINGIDYMQLLDYVQAHPELDVNAGDTVTCRYYKGILVPETVKVSHARLAHHP